LKVVGREASLERKCASVKLAVMARDTAQNGGNAQSIREATIALRGAASLCLESHACYYPDVWNYEPAGSLKLRVVLALADVLIGFVSRMVHAKLSAGVLVEIRQRLFRHCLCARIEGVEHFRHGDLLSRFGSDIPKIQALLVDGVIGFLHNLLFLLLSAVILVYLSPILALWSYLGLALALVLTVAFRAPIEQGTRGIREKMADLSHFLAERLGALRGIRFHRAETQELETFRDLNEQLVQRVLRFQITQSAATQLPGLALSISLAWIYLLGGGQLESGAIGLGTFVAFVLYQGRLYGPASGLLGLVRTLQEARVSLNRVAEILGDEEASGWADYGEADSTKADIGEAETQAAICLENVTFNYKEAAPVLNGLNLRVAPGEKVAVFGTSGAGKSTLVQLLFGLRKPHTGRVSVGTGSRAGSRGRSLHDTLGYASSDPFLLHAGVRENLSYGNPNVTTEKMVEAARLAEANKFILSLPEGFDTVIGGRGHSLSDGQRQRLGLARLFLADPDVLVLDEAFSAMDPETESRVRANLFSAFADRAVLAISHRLTGLDQFDRLLLMREGQLHPVSREELFAYFELNSPQQVQGLET
jgi:ABC-type bacteriocin/lantibiotic exporter with double-glycine peptidase domain